MLLYDQAEATSASLGRKIALSGGILRFTQMTSPATRPKRADAVRNRELLLDAALELFAEQGPDVSLERVAKRAGVGIGTLYRHFPTRDALVEAAYRSEVDRLCVAAEELLADRAPDEALAEWMRRWVEYAAAKKGMADALQSVAASNSGLYADTRARIVAAIESLLAPAVGAGTVRDDVEAADVLQAMGGVWLLVGEPGWEPRAERLLRLITDGLRAQAP